MKQGNSVVQGVEAFARMHSQSNRTLINTARCSRVKGKTPPAICHFAFAAKVSARVARVSCGQAKGFITKPMLFSGLPFQDINAGQCAGIFFGRLNCRLGWMPSRLFSGPSAEFISVNESQDGLQFLQFAPMNNPYRQVQHSTRASWRTGFFNPGT